MGVSFRHTPIAFARDLDFVRSSRVSARRELTVLLSVWISDKTDLLVFDIVGQLCSCSENPS